MKNLWTLSVLQFQEKVTLAIYNHNYSVIMIILLPSLTEIIVSSETTKGFGKDHKALALAVIITNTYEGTTVPLIGIKKIVMNCFKHSIDHCIFIIFV